VAFASVGSLGTAQEKTADTSLTLTVSATAEAGNLVAVLAGCDNEATADGETNQLSISDSAGNTWTKLREQTESSGAADDGCCAAIFVSVLTNQLASGSGTITLTSASTRTAKVMEAWEFTLDETEIALGDGSSVGVAQGGSGQPGAVSVSGMTSRGYLLLYVLGMERESVSFTPGTGYTAMTGAETTGGAADTNQFAIGAYRIATLTSDSPDPSTGTGAQHVQILAAIYEVPAAGSPSGDGDFPLRSGWFRHR
jgi:hypothetical protein